jgi:hypothetical protein
MLPDFTVRYAPANDNLKLYYCYSNCYSYDALERAPQVSCCVQQCQVSAVGQSVADNSTNHSFKP